MEVRGFLMLWAMGWIEGQIIFVIFWCSHRIPSRTASFPIIRLRTTRHESVQLPPFFSWSQASRMHRHAWKNQWWLNLDRSKSMIINFLTTNMFSIFSFYFLFIEEVTMKRYFRKNFVDREFVNAYRKFSRTRPYLSHSSIIDLKCITKNKVGWKAPSGWIFNRTHW